MPPLPPPSTVTVHAPTPPETPVQTGSEEPPPRLHFVYASAAVSAVPLTPPASEYSSDAENTTATAVAAASAVGDGGRTDGRTGYDDARVEYCVVRLRDDGGDAYDQLQLTPANDSHAAPDDEDDDEDDDGRDNKTAAKPAARETRVTNAGQKGGCTSIWTERSFADPSHIWVGGAAEDPKFTRTLKTKKNLE